MDGRGARRIGRERQRIKCSADSSHLWAGCGSSPTPLASTPVVVYERMPDGSERVAVDHPLSNVLRNQPNDETSAADLKQTGQVHALLTGNCFQEVAFNGAGQPAGLYLRNPSRLSLIGRAMEP
jgi:phage portal protein BeeE